MSKLSKEDIYQIVDQYKESKQREPIAIFGAGGIGHDAVSYCAEKCIAVSCIADNNSDLWGSYINGIEVVSPETLKDRNAPLILVSSNFYHEMASQLDEYGLERYLSFFRFRGRVDLNGE